MITKLIWMWWIKSTWCRLKRNLVLGTAQKNQAGQATIII